MSVVFILQYVAGILSIFFNLEMMRIVWMNTPPNFTKYSGLIIQQAFFELLSSICNFVSMQRVIPVRGMTIFASFGVCTNVSPSFCYYFHTMTICFYACSVMMIVFQLIFRYKTLHSKKSKHIQFWSIPMAVLIIAIHIFVSTQQTDTNVLREIVRLKFPQFSMLALNGHDSFSIPVIFLNCSYFLALPAIWISIFVLRRKLLNVLDGHQSNFNISQRSKAMQKDFVKSVTVQVFLSMLAIYPASAYVIAQNEAITEENFLDSCFFFLQLQCAITPLVTVYYMPNYRRAVGTMSRMPRSSTV